MSVAATQTKSVLTAVLTLKFFGSAESGAPQDKELENLSAGQVASTALR
jgi:hypothetical protein